jgi:hypothetical protein
VLKLNRAFVFAAVGCESPWNAVGMIVSPFTYWRIEVRQLFRNSFSNLWSTRADRVRLVGNRVGLRVQILKP